jgi:hypothetical protein
VWTSQVLHRRPKPDTKFSSRNHPSFPTMAEALAGLGVSASVIAVIQISEQVITACLQYYRSVKDAKQDIHAVINVVGGLKTTLENLKMMLDETNDDELPHFRSLDKPLEACGEAIDSLARKLGVDVKLNPDMKKMEFSCMKRAVWPWKEKGVSKHLGTIEKHKATFILAVAGDTLLTTLTTQADVGEIKTGIGIPRDHVSELEDTVSVMPAFILDQETKDILKWLKTSDPSTNHTSARRKHEPTTGTWFLQSTPFKTWKSAPKSLLWLHGIPGAGKTVLCSTIIEDVMNLSGSRRQFVYFYFDFNDPQKKTVNGMLCSLILQLCVAPKREHLPPEVKELFSHCQEGNRQPNFESLRKTFSALTSSSSQTCIVMDALDECSELDLLIDFITQIFETSKHVNLLVTSRKEQVLVEGLERVMPVQIDLSTREGIGGDIDLHIRMCLNTR